MSETRENNETFDVNEKVDQFLADDSKKVLMIQGGAGSGKSAYCNVLLRRVLDSCGKDKVAMLLNLPSMKDPFYNLMDEALSRIRLTSEEIN